MKAIKSNNSALAAALLTFLVSDITAAPLGTAFTYQGRFTDGTNVANGNYDLAFTLYDSDVSTTPLANPLTNSPVVLNNGLFITTLDFGAATLTGANAWLEIRVRTNGSGAFTTLWPRQNLTPAPYAVHAAYADAFNGVLPMGALAGPYSNALALNNAANSFAGNGAGLTNVNADTLGRLPATAFWQLRGNAGTAPGNNFLGTADNQPLELKVDGLRALRLEPTFLGAPNIIGGWVGNVVVDGSVGSTISGGGTPYTMVNTGNGSFSYTNRPNVVALGDGWMGGGVPNYANIGGGIGNTIVGSTDLSTIGGGAENTIGSPYGDEAGAQVGFSAVGGGRQNSIYGTSCVIGGGEDNSIIYHAAYSTIGGGLNNFVDTGFGSTIAGGRDNQISCVSWGSTIGGGTSNNIGRTMAGRTHDCTVAGGIGNKIGAYSTGCSIGGGTGNTIIQSMNNSTISGGCSNTTSGAYSTVAGGYGNTAGGKYSFAVGRRGGALQDGCFVWADSTDADFASTSTNQFLIRASGGVGICKPNPATALDVNGTITASGLLRSGSETGTSEPPSPAGLVVRRINSLSFTAGKVVALTDVLTLERDGSNGGFRLRYPAHPGHQTVACMGLNSSGSAVNFYTVLNDPATAGVVTVFADAQNMVHFQCSFGNTWDAGHLTQATLSRYTGDGYWAGSVTSTFNQ